MVASAGKGSLLTWYCSGCQSSSSSLSSPLSSSLLSSLSLSYSSSLWSFGSSSPSASSLGGHDGSSLPSSRHQILLFVFPHQIQLVTQIFYRLCCLPPIKDKISCKGHLTAPQFSSFSCEKWSWSLFKVTIPAEVVIVKTVVVYEIYELKPTSNRILPRKREGTHGRQEVDKR